MVWHLIGYWLSFILATFYKRIQVHNKHFLYLKDPIVIAMNHPNAFTDPMAISYHTFPLRLYYMARGDAFKPGIASWLLENIGIVPIFRIQDAGKEGLKRNTDSYQRVNRLLERNAKVIVFAEGLCIQERRLRPLKKGVARMVFGAFDHLDHDRLKVVPVGINYSRPDKFRSKILFNVGEPIPVRDYMQNYRENPARAQNIFLQDLEKAMLKEVIHIPRPDLDETVHYAEKLIRSDLMKAHGYPDNLRGEFRASRQIISSIEKAETEQPALFESFKNGAKEYFESLKYHRLKDWLFRPGQQPANNNTHLLLRILLITLVSPLYLAGMIINFPPLFFSYLVTRWIVKSPEFFSSFALGVGMLMFTVIYVAWFFVFYGFFDNLFGALGACLIAGLLGWLCLYVHPFILRTIGLARFLRSAGIAAQLSARRAVLVSIVNKF